MTDLIIIGGGLAGSEAAWQAATRGISVKLYEMRPAVQTGAHVGSDLAELVCSNSLGSNIQDRASGLLKAELRLLKSMLIECADATSVPAGGALAVDRNHFSSMVTEKISDHENITVVREECTSIPERPTIIATGPLSSEKIIKKIKNITGKDNLYFFDALSPIISYESINFKKAYKASRYQKGQFGEGDYINCPLNKEEYEFFVKELVHAERIALKDFEGMIEDGVKAGPGKFFEGCLPIEILARRGKMALAYGPLRPVGLENPQTGERYYAVVQLRQDNSSGTLYNIVGFQTNLKYSEQKRVFRLIPGLENAEFSRYGEMHRNTFIYSPELLRPTLQFVKREDLFFAGQITGVEGYAGNIASGLVAGWNAARYLKKNETIKLPNTTMIGALCDFITSAKPENFQPMKANFGILPPLDGVGRKLNKKERAKIRTDKALNDLEKFIGDIN